VTRDTKQILAAVILAVAAACVGLTTLNCATVGAPVKSADSGDSGWVPAHVNAGFDAGNGALR
jgi:hypothetical protein